MYKKVSLLQRIVNKINRMINPEDQYYADLFILNNDWNNKEPNYEEKLRWQIIKEFVENAKQSLDTQNTNEIKILDIGCGRGWLSNLLSAYGHVVGIEPVKKVAKYANKLFPGLKIIPGTTKTILGKYNDNFHIVVCSEVIEHIPGDHRNEFLKDLYLLSRKQSFLIMTTPRKDAEAEWKKYHDPNQPVEEWLYEAELKDLVTRAGWKEVDLKRFSIKPRETAPEVEIYQLWLFKKNV